jgi:hypothetical protein
MKGNQMVRPKKRLVCVDAHKSTLYSAHTQKPSGLSTYVYFTNDFVCSVHMGTPKGVVIVCTLPHRVGVHPQPMHATLFIKEWLETNNNE